MKGTDRYHIPGLTCDLEGRELRVVNLSVGGLFAATEEPPLVGRVVTIQLRLKGPSPLEIVGSVNWLNEAGRLRVPHLGPGFGLKFLRLSFANRMELLRVLGEADPAAMRARAAGREPPQ